VGRELVTSTEEIINDPNMLSTAVNAIDAVHGKRFAFQPVAKCALYSAFYDASIAHCANRMNAKYIKGTRRPWRRRDVQFPQLRSVLRCPPGRRGDER
jgi:hypothetical protein